MNKRKYTDNQIKKALLLINSGLTRKQAAEATGIKIFSLNYYISKKASPGLRKSLLRKRSFVHTINEVINTLHSLL